MKKKRKYTKRAVQPSLVTVEIHGIGIDLSLSIANDSLAEMVTRSIERLQSEIKSEPKPAVQTEALSNFILSLAPAQTATIADALNFAQKKLWFEAIQNLVPEANDPIPPPMPTVENNHAESA